MRVMIFGTFDDLHPGHEYVFTEAIRRASEDDKLRATSEDDPRSSKLEARSSGVWAVVARDSNVMKIKGRAPLESEDQRMHKIQQMFPDVRTILGNESDFLVPVRAVEPDLILLGYDQKLPPGVKDGDLGVPVERLAAFHPEIHKSSLRRAQSLENKKS